MSRNRGTSSCCSNIVRLSDLRGKPIEFRRYAKEPPAIGTKWVCPKCGTAYFAWWRGAEWDNDRWEWGKFVIDLAYYDSFNDEPSYNPTENPQYLCKDNAEDVQDVW